MSFSMTNILVDLSYLLGEQSVPTSSIEDRKAFIQRSLEEVHRYADWEWTKATATVQLSSGVASLVSMVQQSPNLDVRVLGSGSGADHIFTAVPYTEQDNYGAGDYRYWLTGSQGSYLLNTTETSDSTSVLTYRYDETPADLINGGTTKFPSSLTLARGALRYFRAARDPEYSLDQDDAIFQRGLEEILGKQRRTAPLRRARSIANGVGDIS